MENEEWRPVPGYEGTYEVSNLGRVKSLSNGKLKKEKILKQSKTYHGYLQVGLCRNGDKYHAKVHRIVADAFLNNKENKPHINHKDGDKTNNNVSNIEWCTPSENMAHSYRVLGHISVSNKTNTSYPPKARPVLCLDKDMNIIQSFKSLSQVEKVIGVSRSCVCNSIRKNHKAGGFYWKYAK